MCKEVLWNVRVVKVIVHIAFLFGLLFIGNWIQAALDIAIPGSVIGMLVLFFLLKLGIIKIEWIKEGTQFILKHLTLFFIPVTIGFMDYLELFNGRGILLLFTALLSTALVMGISGAISQQLARKKEIQHD